MHIRKFKVHKLEFLELVLQLSQYLIKSYNTLTLSSKILTQFIWPWDVCLAFLFHDFEMQVNFFCFYIIKYWVLTSYNPQIHIFILFVSKNSWTPPLLFCQLRYFRILFKLLFYDKRYIQYAKIIPISFKSTLY